MNSLGGILEAIYFIVATIILFYNHYRLKRTMDTLEQMLAAAMNGEFLENTFDESRLSAFETKFAHFLSASTVSAKNISIERDKIKTLIADISHQTKTPITNLLLQIELLEEEELTESARTTVESMHSQTEKLRFLIDSLVKLSRLENGILKLNPREEPIQFTLQKVYNQFALEAKRKGVLLRLDESALSAVFDPKWTAEAICNIIENAIKYTEQGSVTISVGSFELFIHVDIVDTGIGIPEDECVKIFSRFYRSKDVRNNEGVGLGLYLAREIIISEGGYIKVSSVYGQGSMFSIFLPR